MIWDLFKYFFALNKCLIKKQKFNISVLAIGKIFDINHQILLHKQKSNKGIHEQKG